MLISFFRLPTRTLPSHAIDSAKAFVLKPKMPVVPVNIALRKAHLTRVAVQGTVTSVSKICISSLGTCNVQTYCILKNVL